MEQNIFLINFLFIDFMIVNDFIEALLKIFKNFIIVMNMT